MQILSAHTKRTIQRRPYWALTLLCLLAWVVSPQAAEAKKKKPKKPNDQVEVKIAWSLGSDRRGDIWIHACSYPLRNDTSGGGCRERDIMDEPLVDYQGTTTLKLKEGRQYNVCFIATDTFNRPGTWGACQTVQGVDGLTFRFDEGHFEFWHGGRWQDQ